MSEETTAVAEAKPTQECPHCKKMVSKLPGPFKRHLNKCTASSVPVVKEPEPKQAKRPVAPSEDLSDVKDPSILKSMREALAIQQSMLEAPETITADMTEDMNKNLVERYAPEAVERYDEKGRPLHTHTPYFGDAREHNANIAKGYLPKVNKGVYVVNAGGDVLYTRPLSITERIVRSWQNESRSRVAGVTEQARSRSSARGIAAPNTRDGEIKEEEFAVTGRINASDIE